MKKISGIMLAVIVSLTALIPLATASTSTGDSELSGNIDPICGVVATNVPFGTFTPGSTSGPLDTTLTQPLAATVDASIAVMGQDWNFQKNPSMTVGATSWATNNTFTEMTTSFAQLAPILGASASLPVHLQVTIPPHQAAGSYIQTITFQASC